MDLNELSQYVIDGDGAAAVDWTERALADGMDALTIINEGLIPGMDVVGERFQQREFFMPEMLVAARAMKAAMAIVKPLLTGDRASSELRAVTGTVQGDLHD
ncbi:MAG TPA: cobalamin-binding protein, partial [Dehalococcoidia bacterium]|nr:cobalamin-binding protein [Dehalococcoidia bacterium]